MKITFLGKSYPVVAVQFSNNAVYVTYFDTATAAPHLRTVTLGHEEFRATVTMNPKGAAV